MAPTKQSPTRRVYLRFPRKLWDLVVQEAEATKPPYRRANNSEVILAAVAEYFERRRQQK